MQRAPHDHTSRGRWARFVVYDRLLATPAEQALRHGLTFGLRLCTGNADIEVDGSTTQWGRRCLVAIGHAHRGSRGHRDPGAFDADLGNVRLRRPLAPGAGPHHCIRQGLAAVDPTTTRWVLTDELLKMRGAPDRARRFGLAPAMYTPAAVQPIAAGVQRLTAPASLRGAQR